MHDAQCSEQDEVVLEPPADLDIEVGYDSRVGSTVDYIFTACTSYDDVLSLKTT